MKKYITLNFWAALFIVSGVLVLCLRGILGDYFFSGKQNFMAPAGRILFPEKENFKFAAVSDTGSANHNLEYILHNIQKHSNCFVLYLGDLVKYRSASHFAWMTGEISGKLKNMPFYAVPGNHDVKNFETILDFSQYRQVFGAEYYWFSYGNTLFIALNNSTESLDSEQFQWLENVLNKIRPLFKYCIIYAHIPPFDVMGVPNHSMDKSSAQKLGRLLQDKNITLLLFGHVHKYTKNVFYGIPVITLPSSGQEIRSEINKYGYVEVQISKKGIKNIDVAYVGKKLGREIFEGLFVFHILNNKARLISGCLILLGCLLILGKKLYNTRRLILFI